MNNIFNFDLLFPETITNEFPGRNLALYVFYLLTAMTLWRSVVHIAVPDGGAQSIATIPLDTYTAGGEAAIITIFAVWGLSQLLIGLIYLTSIIRYRSLIPLLYLLTAVEYAGRFMISQFKPIETVETAPGSAGNIPLAILAVVMLLLSIMPPKKQA